MADPLIEDDITRIASMSEQALGLDTLLLFPLIDRLQPPPATYETQVFFVQDGTWHMRTANVVFDERGRLHSEDGPSVWWTDG